MLIALALLLAAEAAPPRDPPPPSPPPADSEKAGVAPTDEVRLSLPTEEDHDAWAKPGLKVQLGIGYGQLKGLGPAYDFSLYEARLQVRIRLSAKWSIATTLEYAPLTLAGVGAVGLGWSTTVEPIFHPTRALGLALGLGYGGVTFNDGVNARAPETVSRTLDPTERMHSCTSGGLSAIARVDYLFVAGALFASGPYLEAKSLVGRCDQNRGTDTETGLQVTLSQVWTNGGAAAGWWFAWR